MSRPIVFILILLLASCKSDKASTNESETKSTLELSYAKGFQVAHFDGYSELIITTPWPGASRSFTYALVKNSTAKEKLDQTLYDGIITIPIKSIVVTSTTHLPALELLEESGSLVGFPGCDYISSPSIRNYIEQGFIKELGQNEALNTEVVLTLDPDILIGFGIDGVNKAFETISNGGIPIIYNGDWAEGSPLAKAEWLKFFGVLFDKEREADQLFSKIESDYLEAKNIAEKATSIPTVLSGAMHKDIWYLPQGTSPEGQFLRDANVNYLWKDSSGSGSHALSFESVFVTAQNADIWINPSYFTSYEQLKSNSELYTKFKAFRTKSIYSMSLTKGETGGVLYYELGSARPDLVLKDIIKICHPNLLEDYQTTFFKPLQYGSD